MNELGYLVIALLFVLVGLGVYTLFCLRRITRKLNWWRSKAIQTNGMLKSVTYNLKKQAENRKNNELDVSIGKS